MTREDAVKKAEAIVGGWPATILRYTHTFCEDIANDILEAYWLGNREGVAKAAVVWEKQLSFANEEIAILRAGNERKYASLSQAALDAAYKKGAKDRANLIAVLYTLLTCNIVLALIIMLGSK